MTLFSDIKHNKNDGNTFHATHILLILSITISGLLLLLSPFFLLTQPVLASHTQKMTGASIVVQLHGPMQPPGFSPALLTIHLYDTVIFVNQTMTTYAVTADDGSFSSPAIAPGQQWQTTFGILGAHSYHATTGAAGTTMSGEILVVADNVSLLPTPQPQIEATALSIIEAGKHPPDVIQLPINVPATPVHHHVQSPATWLLSLPALLLSIGASLVVCLLIVGMIRLLRSRGKRHARTEDDVLEEEAFALYHSVVGQHTQRDNLGTATLTIAKETQETYTPQHSYQTKHPARSLLQSIRARLHTSRTHNEDGSHEEGDEDEE